MGGEHLERLTLMHGNLEGRPGNVLKAERRALAWAIAALEAVAEASKPFVMMLHYLREDEGDSVTLLCDNPEGPPNNAIECNGAWTGWTERRFNGETLEAAVRAAYLAKREAVGP